MEAKAARKTEVKLHGGGDFTGHWKVERSASAKKAGGIAGGDLHSVGSNPWCDCWDGQDRLGLVDCPNSRKERVKGSILLRIL